MNSGINNKKFTRNKYFINKKNSTLIRYYRFSRGGEDGDSNFFVLLGSKSKFLQG